MALLPTLRDEFVFFGRTLHGTNMKILCILYNLKIEFQCFPGMLFAAAILAGFFEIYLFPSTILISASVNPYNR